MATYNSKVYNDGGRARPNGQDNGNKLTATISIPAGVALASGDILNFARIGENVRITQFELEMDQFDSNATAALAGRLGITASDACLIAAATVLQTNTTGKKNFGRVDGEATAGDSFAVTPFPVQTTVQSVLLTISANAGTPFTTGIRNATLRFEYDYAFPNTYVTGVSDPRYPFAGAITTGNAIVDNYYGNAP